MCCKPGHTMSEHIERQFAIHAKQIERMRRIAQSTIVGWVLLTEEETRSWTPKRLSEPKVALPAKIQ